MKPHRKIRYVFASLLILGPLLSLIIINYKSDRPMLPYLPDLKITDLQNLPYQSVDLKSPDADLILQWQIESLGHHFVEEWRFPASKMPSKKGQSLVLKGVYTESQVEFLCEADQAWKISTTLRAQGLRLPSLRTWQWQSKYANRYNFSLPQQLDSRFRLGWTLRESKLPQCSVSQLKAQEKWLHPFNKPRSLLDLGWSPLRISDVASGLIIICLGALLLPRPHFSLPIVLVTGIGLVLIVFCHDVPKISAQCAQADLPAETRFHALQSLAAKPFCRDHAIDRCLEIASRSDDPLHTPTMQILTILMRQDDSLRPKQIQAYESLRRRQFLAWGEGHCRELEKLVADRHTERISKVSRLSYRDYLRLELTPRSWYDCHKVHLSLRRDADSLHELSYGIFPLTAEITYKDRVEISSLRLVPSNDPTSKDGVVYEK